jgi:hypothetical protein
MKAVLASISTTLLFAYLKLSSVAAGPVISEHHSSASRISSDSLAVHFHHHPTSEAGVASRNHVAPTQEPSGSQADIDSDIEDHQGVDTSAQRSPLRHRSPHRENARAEVQIHGQDPHFDADYLRWMESVLMDGLSPERTSSLPASSSHLSSGLESATASSQSGHGKADSDARRQYRSYKAPWVRGYNSDQQRMIREAVDKIAATTHAHITSVPRRRFEVMKNLSVAQMDDLLLGLPITVSNTPAPIIGQEKRQRKYEGQWKTGISKEDQKTINEFIKLLMSLRRGNSQTTRSLLMANLSRDELMAIARKDEAEKARIMERLMPIPPKHPRRKRKRVAPKKG